MEALADCAFVPVGLQLHRPECVLGAMNGDVYVSNWDGGVTVIRADGSQESWLARDGQINLRPNGFTFLPDGRFLIANLGDDGGLWTLDTEGHLEPFLVEVEGNRLPPANFAWIDEESRIWCSFSTRHVPRQAAWRNDVMDGFVVVIDRKGARVALDMLHYANEVRTCPSGDWLYVVETFSRQMTRFPIGANARLGSKEAVATFGDGFFPDGFAFDAEGAVWVTSLLSNQIVRILPDGSQQLLYAEPGMLDHGLRAQSALRFNTMPPDQLAAIPGSRFQHITSIGFGGTDNKTAWLGNLHATRIFKFESDIPGASVPYQKFRLP